MYYKCEQISKHFNVSIWTVWRWIREKKLPAADLGKEYRVSDADLKIFEAARRTVRL